MVNFGGENKVKYINESRPSYDLTYNDVFLVPSFSDISSRFTVDLTTPDNLGTTIPIVVANMSAVAGKRMSETVARRGGITILPQDIPLDTLESMISYVKSRHTIYETPLTLQPHNTISEALNIIYKRSHGIVVIVNEKDEPVGIFEEKDAYGYDRFTPLSRVVTDNVITLPIGLSPKEMFERLDKQHIHAAPVVEAKKLVGIVTRKGSLRSSLYTPAVDKQNQLMVGVAIGINGDVAEKAKRVIELGSDVLVIDTAHGHQQKMIDAIKSVRKIDKHIPIVAGNVVTPEATNDLIDAGATIVKVGVGPGAMCTTRMMTGVGRPQFSAVAECAFAARKRGCSVWADGGIRHPRDVALALAAGASSAMFASWFTGTYESTGDTLRDNEGRLYKENYGMASKRAVKERSNTDSSFNQSLKEFFEEGISSSKLYIQEDKPGVEDIIDHIIAGVRSSMTYAGAKTINELYQNAVVGIQSSAGYEEGKPVNATWN